jgi:hypothetical protein
MEIVVDHASELLLPGVGNFGPRTRPFPARDGGYATDSAASGVDTVLQLNDYTSFATQLEGIRDLVHVLVGGTMGSIPTFPP